MFSMSFFLWDEKDRYHIFQSIMRYKVSQISPNIIFEQTPNKKKFIAYESKLHG